MGVLGEGILLGPPSCLFGLSSSHRVEACILRYLGGGRRKFYFFGLVSRLMGGLGASIQLGLRPSWHLFGGGWLMLKGQESVRYKVSFL
jgi:hypothetical protein